MNTAIKSILIFLFLSPCFAIGQKVSHNQVRIQSIHVNETQINEASWGNLEIYPEDKIHYTIVEPEGVTGRIQYKIFLNGQITNVEQRSLDGGITFEKLKAGSYILKILPYTIEGNEFIPVIHHFIVDNVKVSNNSEKNIASVNYESYLNIHTLGIVCVIQLLLIIVLLLRGKSRGNNTKGAKYDELVEELSDYKYSYKRLKEEIANQIDANTYLQKQLKDLDAHIKDLEKANIQLLEQKERLSESKLQLEELQAQKEELFTMAIHDIKNPASVIKSCVQLLTSYDLNATDQHELISSIMASSDNLVQLSQNMCTIIAKSKPEPTLKFVKGSLKKIIDDVCLHNMSYAKAKEIKLFNKASQSLPDVFFDHVKIEEAIDNLVNNAIKYGPPGTNVEVNSYLKNNKQVIEVKDTGRGLSDDDLKRVFKKGAILSNKPTGVEQSSGLGLWLVKKIINEHGGDIRVESKINKGSSFILEIPYMPEG